MVSVYWARTRTLLEENRSKPSWPWCKQFCLQSYTRWGFINTPNFCGWKEYHQTNEWGMEFLHSKHVNNSYNWTIKIQAYQFSSGHGTWVDTSAPKVHKGWISTEKISPGRKLGEMCRSRLLHAHWVGRNENRWTTASAGGHVGKSGSLYVTEGASKW